MESLALLAAMLLVFYFVMGGCVGYFLSKVVFSVWVALAVGVIIPAALAVCFPYFWMFFVGYSIIFLIGFIYGKYR